MTTPEVAQMIASVGLPYAYYQFPENTGQQPPFICFYYPQSNDFKADDTNYQKINALTIELYTDNKDFGLEAQVEGMLKANGLVFSWAETYIDSERMHLTTYYTEVIIDV